MYVATNTDKLSAVCTYADAVKVVGIHDCSLVELYLGEVTLEQTFQLKIRLFPVHAVHEAIKVTMRYGTVRRPLLPYGYSYKASCARPSFVIFDTLTLRAERQSARMSKIANGGLTRSGTGCFIAVPI